MSYCTSVAGSEIARFRPSFQAETDDLNEPRTKLQFSSENIRNENLSVLIVSSQNVCDRVKTCMSDIIARKYSGNIFIKLAESVEQILNSGISYTTIDYIVFIFDTTQKMNMKKLKADIMMIESSYVATRRMCFVNGSPKIGIKGTDLEIVELAQQFNLLNLNGRIMDAEGCKRLCERILDLVTSTCGFNGGVPFIIPTAMDVFRQLFT